MTPITIRPYTQYDAPALAELIAHTLTTVNAKDYDQAVIDDRLAAYTAESIRRDSARKTILVAERESQLVGTGALEGNLITGVFTSNTQQGQGIGRLIMAALEDAARQAGHTKVMLSSSTTAQSFYETIGYHNLKAERWSIVMEKALTQAP